MCAVPVSKNTSFACAQPGTHIFVDLYANQNPSHVIYERTVHEGASLGTQHMPASTSNTDNKG